MLRFRTGLNYGWRFTPDYSPKKSKNENFDTTIRPVDIPHNSGSARFSCFNGEDESKIVQYSKLFVIPDEMEGKRIILHFDGVMPRQEERWGKPTVSYWNYNKKVIKDIIKKKPEIARQQIKEAFRLSGKQVQKYYDMA